MSNLNCEGGGRSCRDCFDKIKYLEGTTQATQWVTNTTPWLNYGPQNTKHGSKPGSKGGELVFNLLPFRFSLFQSRSGTHLGRFHPRDDSALFDWIDRK